MQAPCSECGHTFTLFDVFYPQVNDQRGFVEHARSWFGYIGRALRTWLWALVPNWFWRRVMIRQRISVRRMLLWPLVVLLFLHAVNAAAGMAVLAMEQHLGAPHQLPTYTSMLTWPVLVMADETGAWVFEWTIWECEAIVYALPMIPFHLTWPVMLLVLSESRRQAKIRRAHLARGVVYGLSWIFLLPLIRTGWLAVEATDLGLHGVAGAWWWGGFWSSALPVLWRQEIEPFFTIWVVGGFVWLTWWWWSAIIQGWRFHQGWLVALLLTIVAMLVTSLVALSPLLFM